MNKPYLISTETLTTIMKGALGAMTFGAYHQFNTNKMMDLNNEIIQIKHKADIDRLEIKHKSEIDNLREHIEKLEKRWW